MNTDDAPQRIHRIALLSTSDTDLLSARASLAAYKLGNPARQSIEAVLDGAEVVVLREIVHLRQQIHQHAKPEHGKQHGR